MYKLIHMTSELPLFWAVVLTALFKMYCALKKKTFLTNNVVLLLSLFV